MRMIAAILLAIVPSAASADYILKGQFRAPCDMTPPTHALAEPNVPYEISVWPQAKVERACKGDRKVSQPVTACAMPPGWIGNEKWIIAVSSFLSPADYACVLLYEKAHLPPNNWVDQEWETYIEHGGADPR